MYLPRTRKIISSYDVVFDESISSALAYTSQPHSESMAVRLSMTYTTYDTSSEKQTGNVITFTSFRS